MIKSIRIKNYQSHRDTTIVLSRGITGIIGKSNTGKTVIIRALKWLLTNRPAGFRFHSNFTKNKKTEVQALLGNNSIIRLSKQKGGSKYEVLLADGGEPIVFKKFGGKVPDQVVERFNIGEVNIQSQMDGPFLITSPPGKIAETINRATKIEQVSGWIKEVNRKITKRKNKLELVEETLEDLEEQLDVLDEIEEIGEDIRRLKKVDRKINRLNSELAEITGLIAGIEATEQAIAEAEAALVYKKKVAKLERIDNEINNLERENDLLAEYGIMKRNIKTALVLHAQTVDEYIELIKDNKSCPTCYSTIDSKTIKRIKREISIAK